MYPGTQDNVTTPQTDSNGTVTVAVARQREQQRPVRVYGWWTAGIVRERCHSFICSEDFEPSEHWEHPGTHDRANRGSREQVLQCPATSSGPGNALVGAVGGVAAAGIRVAVAAVGELVTADVVAAEGVGAIDAPVGLTQEGETFVRVGAGPENLKFTFDTPGGTQPGTYAFPEGTFNEIGPNPEALKNFGDLPGEAPAGLPDPSAASRNPDPARHCARRPIWRSRGRSRSLLPGGLLT